MNYSVIETGERTFIKKAFEQNFENTYKMDI